MKVSRILFVLIAIVMIQCETIPARIFEEIENQKEISKNILSEQEINSLMHLREEEMLAYDVYTFLSGLYDVPIFRNIAKSEMIHTTRVKDLIDKYELEDPAVDRKSGVFKDEGIQELYDGLTVKGKISYKDAIVVGLTIEDLDINDLEMALENDVDNEDIVEVYNFLLMGSKNHTKAFFFHAKSNDIEYIPQYISQERFLEIVEEE
jgi:hypothetical protein